MKWRYPVLIFGGFCCSAWGFIYRPFPMPGEEPLLDLLLYHTPNFYIWVVRWYYVAPAVAVVVGGLIINTVYHVWFEKVEDHLPSYKVLPDWPLSPKKDAGPGIVVGEVHHPVKAVEIPNPKWLVIPERGLYTGVAIFGAVGSGKTSACMHPFAQQILSWQARNPEVRAAALVLEVKGDFCHDIRKILADAGREDDYIELGMDGRWQWNPLSTKVLDSYSLAYTVSSLLNQLFGKGKEPFWQQAYTNLVRWIIELHRVLPDQWVTLRQVYHCAIDKELFEAKIKAAEAYVRQRRSGTLFISSADYGSNLDALAAGKWIGNLQEGTYQKHHSAAVESQLKGLNIKYEIKWSERHGWRRNPPSGRSRQSLVSTRLGNDRQQDPVEHSGGNIRFPFHIRPAGRGQSVLSAKAPGASPSSASPRRPRRPPQVHPAWTWDESASELATPR